MSVRLRKGDGNEDSEAAGGVATQAREAASEPPAAAPAPSRLKLGGATYGGATAEAPASAEAPAPPAPAADAPPAPASSPEIASLEEEARAAADAAREAYATGHGRIPAANAGELLAAAAAAAQRLAAAKGG